jgi:DNA-binding beta-propeller fold protein YncE
VRRVRAIQTRKVGISSPAGLAFSPRANAFVVLAGRGASFSDLRLIGPLREALGSARIAEVVTNPVNMAFDVKGNRLLILQSRGRRLVQIAAGSDGKLVPSRVTRVDLRHFGLQDPQGMTVDPATGHLFILDAALPRILRVEPGSSRAVPA